MNEILSSEEPSSLEKTTTYLSKEKIGKDSNERTAGKSSEKVEERTARKAMKTIKEKRLDSKESSSFSGSKEKSESKESVKCAISSKKSGSTESLRGTIKWDKKRPFCYDESLDGVTKSLINSMELEDDETKPIMTSNFKYPFVQPSSHTQKVFKDKRTKAKEEFVENQVEESETDEVQEMEKMPKFNLLRDESSVFDWRDRSTANYVLSAQKLVKGENIMDFTCNYIFSKKSLEGVMKLEHKFLWKQQRHISDFRRSEAADEGKNQSPTVVNFNEGAVRLLPTMTNDSQYIHASRLNTPYGNFIITQGPTKQSLIDFFRMLWQCHVLLVARGRISIETLEVMETSVADLLVYEAVLTNMEIRNGSNRRCIHIMRYDKWTHEKTISPVLLVKMITVMEAMNEKERKPIVVHGSQGIRRTAIFVITSLLIRQVRPSGLPFLSQTRIANTHRMSVLKAAVAVCRRRYGVLRLLADYRLILQSALCYAKECDLIRNEKTFMDAINVSESPVI
ncbi:unnamed protein product [Onchocerca ochengi]|uniref:Tyrosine-protein phosphatase domain-containing protein n=1 Tax=Onchocerca ochengi TaxID=42157 RepID=A0A182E0K7_ONCOC|nr:unnamed protein product [Onchocerca ochengi]